jgi:hypothetical protein
MSSPYPELRIKTPPADDDDEPVMKRSRRSRITVGKLAFTATSAIILFLAGKNATGHTITPMELQAAIGMILMFYCLVIAHAARESSSAPSTPMIV